MARSSSKKCRGNMKAAFSLRNKAAEDNNKSAEKTIAPSLTARLPLPCCIARPNNLNQRYICRNRYRMVSFFVKCQAEGLRVFGFTTRSTVHPFCSLAFWLPYNLNWDPRFLMLLQSEHQEFRRKLYNFSDNWIVLDSYCQSYSMGLAITASTDPSCAATGETGELRTVRLQRD